MRRALLLSLLVLAVAAPASAAGPTLTLKAPTVHYLAVDHSLWVRTAWTPAAVSTNVTVVVRQGSHTLRTLRATRWLIGTKTFMLALPKTIPAGSELSVQVRATSSAGSGHTEISVPLA